MITYLDKGMFDATLKIKKLLHSNTDTTSVPSDPATAAHGVKLPKLDVLNGYILKRIMFWDRPHLSKAEKLVYLRHSLKDGAAKSIIERLSKSGDKYDEAVKCLNSRFNHPKLIHEAHMQRIIEIPQLKEGNGRELRTLHDNAQQHIRALKHNVPHLTATIKVRPDHTF